MAAGYPEGAPLRLALTDLYEGVQPTQFLRTTYKAGPLVMIGLGVLAGLAADAAWRRVPRPGAAGAGRRGRRRRAGPRGLAAGERRGGRRADPVRLPAELGARGRGPRPHAPGGHPVAGAPGQPVRLPRAGAGPPTRRSRRSPTSRPRPASSFRTPTRARPTCCGRWTAWWRRAGRFPGQLPPLVDLMGAGRGDRARSTTTRGAPAACRRPTPPARWPAAAWGARHATTGRSGAAPGSSFVAGRRAPAARAAPLRRRRLRSRAGAPARPRHGGRRLGRRSRRPGRVRRPAARPPAPLRRRPEPGRAAAARGARRELRDLGLQPPPGVPEHAAAREPRPHARPRRRGGRRRHA